MMAILSLAWWTQKLSGVAAQAAAVVIGVALLAGGLAWLRHDARMDERGAWELRMANARMQQLALRQRREREAAAIGGRAEKNLLDELSALESLNANLESQLAKRPSRVVCYPKDIVRSLNR